MTTFTWKNTDNQDAFELRQNLALSLGFAALRKGIEHYNHDVALAAFRPEERKVFDEALRRLQLMVPGEQVMADLQEDATAFFYEEQRDRNCGVEEAPDDSVNLTEDLE